MIYILPLSVLQVPSDFKWSPRTPDPTKDNSHYTAMHIVFLFLYTDQVCSQLEDNQRLCICLLLGLILLTLRFCVFNKCNRGCSRKQVCVLNMGDQRSVTLLPLMLLLMLLARLSQLWAFPFSPSLDLDVTPRTTVFSKGEGVTKARRIHAHTLAQAC